MATFSDDFSTHTVSTVANSTTPNAITGWTGQFPASSDAYISATITSGTSPVADRFLRFIDTGWGSANKALYPTSIGNIAANTETEILCCWRLDTAIAACGTTSYAPGFIRQNTGSLGRRYQVGLNKSGATELLQLWYVQDADEWTSVGASYDVSTPYVLGEWWWTRLKVSSSGGWLWRSWEDGELEPGTWQNAETTDTTVTGGYCGIGMYTEAAGNDFDVAWFSVGTGGDGAPSPGGGDPPVITDQPDDVTGYSGGTVQFTVAATGGTLTYQWQRSTDGGASYSNVSGGSGGTTATYTTPTLGFTENGYFYRCAVTDENGTTDSNGARLTLIPASPVSWLRL